jgi:hypothetical protein|nr:DUF397 domain-containing protein [Actinomadura meyerae]
MSLARTAWRKSSRSNECGDACIELAVTDEAVLIRDSQDADGLLLVISRGDFRDLADALKNL